MKGRVGFRIRAPWPRPTEQQLSAFGGASSAQIADSMCRLGAMDAGIKPMWASPRVVGPAITVWARSADNLMFHKSLSLAQPGDILVINTQNNVSNAGFGELMATTAVRVGIRAVVVDGVVRDVSAIQAMGLPLYARGRSPNGCEKFGPGEIGTIIACGGVAVRPGDIIVADEDGITVIPLADADEVANLAAVQVERERKRIREIESGVLFRPEIDESLRRHGVID